MRKNHFIVVVAHSDHGRISRVHVPHYAIHIVAAVVLLATIASIGLFSSYTRMAVKAFEFNEMRAEKEALQRRHDELARQAEERGVQLESLGNLATEVSMAFGIKRQADEAGELGLGLSSEQSYSRSLSQYDFLQQVQVSAGGSGSVWEWLENTTPSIWPVQGRLSSSFGKRKDPFVGTGGFHAGVDLTARHGTPIVAVADGMVIQSGWFAKYGKRVVLSHGGNGLTTRYAHMSEFFVRPGQVVRRGEVIGRVGRTGRTTSPHLHYEVRYLGTPLNPYKYLRRPLNQRVGFRVAD